MDFLQVGHFIQSYPNSIINWGASIQMTQHVGVIFSKPACLGCRVTHEFIYEPIEGATLSCCLLFQPNSCWCLQLLAALADSDVDRMKHQISATLTERKNFGSTSDPAPIPTQTLPSEKITSNIPSSGKRLTRFRIKRLPLTLATNWPEALAVPSNSALSILIKWLESWMQNEIACQKHYKTQKGCCQRLLNNLREHVCHNLHWKCRFRRT